MRKMIAVILSACLTLSLFGCGGSTSATSADKPSETQEQAADSSEAPETEAETKAANETEQESQAQAGGAAGSADEIVGDWSGQTEVHTEYNDGPFEAILSINADNTWASCVNGSFNWGTWEAASEKGNRVILTVQYAGIDATNTWSFERHPDGYYYEYVSIDTIEIPMTKMASESADQIYNDWYGEVTYKDDFSQEEETAKASLSINTDKTWSSDVSGSNNSGNVRFVSEAGHLAVFDVVYEGTDSTNQWGFIKKPDGKFYYEYVYGQVIEIPVDPL